MTPQEKAKELVDKYMPHVYCFMGSGMLTNYYDESVAKSNAKACAIIAVNELIDLSDRVSDIANNYFKDLSGNYKDAEYELKFWFEVKEEIEKQ